jgi:hypothetical protein
MKLGKILGSISPLAGLATGEGLFGNGGLAALSPLLAMLLKDKKKKKKGGDVEVNDEALTAAGTAALKNPVLSQPPMHTPPMVNPTWGAGGQGFGMPQGMGLFGQRR